MKNPFSIHLLCVVLVGMFLLPGLQSLAEPPTAAAASRVSAPLNTLTEAEQEAGWKLLFDGKTTHGWRSFRKQGANPGWKVIDSALTRVGNDAGDLVTVDKYGSFELSLDYNISRGGNSGVMFHVTGQYPLPWMSGPEVQIVDNKEGHDPQLSGWLYDLYPATVDATKPPGQWNHLRIIVTPRKCETYVNGVKYCQYVLGSKDWDSRVAKSKFAKYPEFGKATSGYIALQDHRSRVAFRNIKIRAIPVGSKTTLGRAFGSRPNGPFPGRSPWPYLAGGNGFGASGAVIGCCGTLGALEEPQPHSCEPPQPHSCEQPPPQLEWLHDVCPHEPQVLPQQLTV